MKTLVSCFTSTLSLHFWMFQTIGNTFQTWVKKNSAKIFFHMFFFKFLRMLFCFCVGLACTGGVALTYKGKRCHDTFTFACKNWSKALTCQDIGIVLHQRQQILPKARFYPSQQPAIDPESFRNTCGPTDLHAQCCWRIYVGSGQASVRQHQKSRCTDT